MLPLRPISDKDCITNQIPQHQTSPVAKSPFHEIGRQNCSNVLWVAGEILFTPSKERAFVCCSIVRITLRVDLEITVVDKGFDGEIEIVELVHDGLWSLAASGGGEVTTFSP